MRAKPRVETLAPRSLARRREDRRRHGMLTRVARPFGAPPFGFPDSNKSGFAVLQAISSTSTFSATEGWAALWSVRPSAFNRLLQFVGEAGHVGVEVGVVRHVQKHAAAHVEPWATRFAEYAEPTTLVDPDVSAVDFPFWPAADEVMMRDGWARYWLSHTTDPTPFKASVSSRKSVR